jgi:hypothetical protein
MKVLLAVASMVSLLGCSSTTVGPGASWGTVAGIPFAPADGFFLLSADATTGDYNFVLIAASRVGYCAVLQQNFAGYPANIDYAIFTFSNPVGTGQVNPGPGTYPITDAAGAASSAQATFGSVSSSCVTSPAVAGTSGSLVMSTLAVDLTQMTGSLNVGFGTSGSLVGSFVAPLCDTSNSIQGPSTCYQ